VIAAFSTFEDPEGSEGRRGHARSTQRVFLGIPLRALGVLGVEKAVATGVAATGRAAQES